MTNIPGFTGGMALYASRAQYSTSATSFSSGKAEVRPQLPAQCREYRQHLATLYQGLSDAYARRNWQLVDVYSGSIRAFTNMIEAEC